MGGDWFFLKIILRLRHLFGPAGIPRVILQSAFEGIGSTMFSLIMASLHASLNEFFIFYAFLGFLEALVLK